MAQPDKAHFSLLDEPFIFATDLSGVAKEYSMLELLHQAKSVKEISGTSTLQEFALVRLLLAVLYRALPEETATKADWLQLWRTGIPQDKVKAYLEHYRNRFDLIDDTSPFYQVPTATYEKAELNLKPSLVELYVDYRKALGTQTNSRGPSAINFAEAARRLIEVQNYRTASKKSLLQGDTHKLKRNYAQLGWCGNFTGILLVGDNLEQTLLLNLTPYEALPGTTQSEDLPVWERMPQTVATESSHMLGELEEYGLAVGPVELYTSQAARIKLLVDEDVVIGARVGVGDRLFKYNQHNAEPMASWLEKKRQSGDQAWMPVKTSGTEVWRGLSTFLAYRVKNASNSRVAANLEFFREIEEALDSDLEQLVRLKTFDVAYGSQDAIINDTLVSQLALAPTLLKIEAADSLDVVLQAATLAEEGAKVYRDFVANLYVAEGKERMPVKGTSVYQLAAGQQQALLYDLGLRYEKWVAQLSPDDLHLAFLAWRKELNSVVRSAIAQYASQVSQRAIVGRMEGAKASESTKRVVNLGTASDRASFELMKLLPKPQEEQT